jgi:putative sigma-54 modulation protein
MEQRVMNIQITARHFKARPDLQEFIEGAVNGLTQLYDGIVSADVVLEVETQNNNDNKMAEVSLLVYKDKLFAKEKSDDFTKSVGACIEKLERQLIKYKQRMHEGQQPHERPEVTTTDEV